MVLMVRLRTPKSYVKSRQSESNKRSQISVTFFGEATGPAKLGVAVQRTADSEAMYSAVRTLALPPYMDLTHLRPALRDVGDLGHVGGSLEPVGYRRPGFLGYLFDQPPHVPFKARGHREAHVGPAAGGYDLARVEAGVGPHGQLTRRPGVADPGNRRPARPIMRTLIATRWLVHHKGHIIHIVLLKDL